MMQYAFPAEKDNRGGATTTSYSIVEHPTPGNGHYSIAVGTTTSPSPAAAQTNNRSSSGTSSLSAAAQTNNRPSRQSCTPGKCIGDTIVAIVSLAFIIWLIFFVCGPNVQIDYFHVSSLNVTNSQISGNWDLVFEAENLNHDRVVANLYYGSEFLGGTRLETLEVDGHPKRLSGRIAASSLSISNSTANAIAGEERLGVLRSFHVELYTESMTVVCGNIMVQFSPDTADGMMPDGPRNCKVKLSFK